jgi:hypothetical protein
MIYKNWPKDAQVGCYVPKKDVGEFFIFEANLFEAHEEESDQSASFEDDCNCCNIFLTNMDLILTCLCNLHFEF